jgi:hypothetical protein
VSSNETTVLRRWVSAFGRFWCDFLVGDTPEITAAVLVIVAVVALLRDVVHANVAAYVVLVVSCIAALTMSSMRGRKLGG